MAVFEVNVWIVSEGKNDEHESLMRRIVEYERADPKKFKEHKSFRYFRGWSGEPSPVGGRVCIWEFNSLVDMEKMYERLKTDEEFNNMDKEWLSLVEPSSVKRHIWHDVNREIWME
ncbi:MAG: hypothetical protein NWF14_01075 [Candidatus Bathyarchaeota archaeon]|nr:hypothetical protein [Candidatus Bathyarchaeota archaeon]